MTMPMSRVLVAVATLFTTLLAASRVSVAQGMPDLDAIARRVVAEQHDRTWQAVA